MRSEALKLAQKRYYETHKRKIWDQHNKYVKSWLTTEKGKAYVKRCLSSDYWREYQKKYYHRKKSI